MHNNAMNSNYQSDVNIKAEYDMNNEQITDINMSIDVKNSLFPYCIVWTPLPIITWLIPIIGHMGIAYSNGVIRDFAGSYYVSEGNMAFGKPTKYWRLKPSKVNPPTVQGWNQAIMDASTVYTSRMHNLFFDNCHSHVAFALNRMQYDGSKRWNMIKLCFLMLIKSKYVSVSGFLKTWLPFCLIIMFALFIYVSSYQYY